MGRVALVTRPILINYLGLSHLRAETLLELGGEV